MCPNCITTGTWIWIIPGLISLFFIVIAGSMIYFARTSGEFKGDEEEAKYAVFD